MAKKTGKKVRKSGKSKPKDSSKAKSIPPAPDNVVKAPARKSEIRCKFCDKPMKDDKTRKIHERNCKEKIKAPPVQNGKNLESEFLELKDRFEDERQNMAKTFQEKEDHLQRELEEVKTVLRLEIDRHRKELERISKVEKEVERQAAPEPKPEVPEPFPGVPKQLPDVPEQSAEVAEHAPAPAPARSQQPRAIDMIPIRIPHIPRRKIPEMEDDEPIPDLDEEPEKKATPGLDRAAIEEIVKSMVGQPQSPGTIDTGNIDMNIKQVTGKMEFLETKLERGIFDLRKAIDRSDKDMDFKRMTKDLERVSERVLDIMEDSGFGENLSVAKIPPTILEIVYQAIMDDVMIEIVRTKGPQDAERTARSALEEVRLKTSGSELFKFDGRKIVTDNLAKSIEANLISAKQIQTTYDVLMENLLETVPHHKAKNFKGMIKVKSQEFAVDRATKLTKDFARIEKSIESINQMMAAMSANINSQHLEVREKLTNLSETALAAKANVDDMNALQRKLDEANERHNRLADELSLIKAEMDMKSSIREKESTDDAFLTPGEEPFVAPPEVPEGGVFTAQPPQAEDIDSDNIQKVLGAISNRRDSKNAIVKETGLDASVVAQSLATLVEAKKIIEKRSGKRIRYTTLELELGKLKEEESPQEKKSGKRKKSELPEEVEEKPERKREPGVIVLGDDEPDIPEPEVEPLADASEPDSQVEIQDEAPAEPSMPETQAEISIVPPEPEKKPGRKKARKMKEPERVEAPTEAEAPEPDSEPSVEEPVAAPEIPEEKAPRKKKGKHAAKHPPEKEEKTSEPAPEEQAHATDEFPVVRKELSELSDEELRVLEAITRDGMTLSGIQSKVGKHLKRFVLLRALRVLIDSGHVGIVAKGRMELYQRITVEKMDKKLDEEKNKEVK